MNVNSRFFAREEVEAIRPFAKDRGTHSGEGYITDV